MSCNLVCFFNFDIFGQIREKVSVFIEIHSVEQVGWSFEHLKSYRKMAQSALFWPVCTYIGQSTQVKGILNVILG